MLSKVLRDWPYPNSQFAYTMNCLKAGTAILLLICWKTARQLPHAQKIHSRRVTLTLTSNSARLSLSTPSCVYFTNPLKLLKWPRSAQLVISGLSFEDNCLWRHKHLDYSDVQTFIAGCFSQFCASMYFYIYIYITYIVYTCIFYIHILQ